MGDALFVECVAGSDDVESSLMDVVRVILMFLGLDGERRFSLLLHDTMNWIYLVGNVIAIFY